MTDQMLSEEDFLTAIQDFDPLAAPKEPARHFEISRTASPDVHRTNVEIEVEIRPRPIGVSSSKSFSVMRTGKGRHSCRFSIRRSHHGSFNPENAKFVLSMTSSRSEEDEMLAQIAAAAAPVADSMTIGDLAGQNH